MKQLRRIMKVRLTNDFEDITMLSAVARDVYLSGLYLTDEVLHVGLVRLSQN
jgi:hypothetical protein